MHFSESDDDDEDLCELAAFPGLYQEIIPKESKINNKVALESAITRIKNGLPWIERLDIVTDAAPTSNEQMSVSLKDLDPNDDFKREAYFYRVAQAGVLKALPRLQQLQVPTKRPSDFYAEMIKTDQHMTKVKERLVVKSKRIELTERARQIREARKLGKKTQQAAHEAKRLEKKKLNDAVKTARKRRGDADRTKMLSQILGDFTPDDIPQSNRQKKKQELKMKGGYNNPKDMANKRKRNQRRDFKNTKFGHGGQKKRGKRNTSDSLNSSGFSRAVHQSTSKAHADSIRKKAQQLRASRSGKSKSGKSRK